MMEAVQSPAGALPMLASVAKNHGITDPAELRACIEHPAIGTMIDATYKEAADKVTGTPTLFINGALAKDHSFAGLQKDIEAILNPSAPPAAATPAAAN
jgi:protein-disulfide isomerase